MLRVEAHRWLVENEEIGLVQRGPGDVEQAAPAPGELSRWGCGVVGKPGAFHRVDNRPAGIPAAEAGQTRRETQVLRDGEQAVYADLLEHEPQPLPHGATLSRGVVAEDASAAAGGCQQGGEKEHCGGLAGAVGPQEPDQCTRGYLEVEGLERSRLAVVTSQPLGEDGRPGFAHTC